MITTVLEAQVEENRWDELVTEYRKVVEHLSPQIVTTSLLQESSDRSRWLIVTSWQSREGLQEYRESVATPEGVLVFRAVGAEPTLAIFDVVDFASNLSTQSPSHSHAASPEAG